MIGTINVCQVRAAVDLMLDSTFRRFDSLDQANGSFVFLFPFVLNRTDQIICRRGCPYQRLRHSRIR